MNVIFAGGGTGGHVYPSLAVARALDAELALRGEPLDALYIGIRGRIDEQIVPKEGMAFRAVSAGPLRVDSPLVFARNTARLAAGVVQSLRILLRFQPAAVFATGGYASVPVGIATRLLRKPLIVYLPDVAPGWAVRLLARLATVIATTSESARTQLPAGKTIVTGYPVRDEFFATSRDGARQTLGLPHDATVLLVTGASLGAHNINEAIVAALPSLLARCYVVHLTGAADEHWAGEQRAKLNPEQQARYVVRGYAPDIAVLMSAADLVISRSGASTLGELPAAAAPAILVPGEYEGWSQAPNAEYLESERAAVMLRNSDLSRLASTTLELLDDTARLASMRERMRTLARPHAARDLARTVIEAAA